MNQLHATLLIIADNLLVSNDLQLLLTSHGHNVTTATSISEAFGAIATHSPNIIFIDLDLYE